MAKKQEINGTMYLPRKAPMGWPVCKYCHEKQWAKSIVYTIDGDEDGGIYCLECVSRMKREIIRQKDRENKLKKKNEEKEKVKNTFYYSIEEPLYVVRRTQPTSKGNNGFDTVYAIFKSHSEKKDKRFTILFQKSTNRYYITEQQFEQQWDFFRDYNLLDPTTNKQYTGIEDESYPAFSKTKTQVEIPSTVRWAITHPFQGGKVSPK